MIRALLTRIALRRYVRLGAFIAKNADLLTPLDISRLHEEGRWTQEHARRVHRERQQ